MVVCCVGVLFGIVAELVLIAYSVGIYLIRGNWVSYLCIWGLTTSSSVQTSAGGLFVRDGSLLAQNYM